MTLVQAVQAQEGSFTSFEGINLEDTSIPTKMLLSIEGDNSEASTDH